MPARNCWCGSILPAVLPPRLTVSPTIFPRDSRQTLRESQTRTFGHLPFGDIWYETGTIEKFKFTSYERDTESNLDYATFRFSSSRLGRFMSADPMAGQVVNPQSLNRYSYAFNDPIDLADPSGLSVWINCLMDEVGNCAGGGGIMGGFGGGGFGGGSWFDYWMDASHSMGGLAGGAFGAWINEYQDRQLFGAGWYDLPGHSNPRAQAEFNYIVGIEVALYGGDGYLRGVSLALGQMKDSPYQRIQQSQLQNLRNCVRQIYNITVRNFVPIAPGSNGLFYGADAKGRDITVETNTSYSSWTLGVMALNPGPIAGLTYGSTALNQLNYVASDQPMAYGFIQPTQIHELGHALDNITSGSSRGSSEASADRLMNCIKNQ